MGISGLLQLLSSIVDTVHISAYANQRVGIDAYAWLHRASYTCSTELCLGQPTEKYLDWCMNKLQLLQSYNVIPVMIFDGGKLPEKRKTEQARKQFRDKHRALGLSLLASGNEVGAYKAFQKAVDITPAIARRLMSLLKLAKIEFIVAPYEADAQLAYLSMKGNIQAVISEDSDLLVFGCKRVLFKMDGNGSGQEIRLKNLGSVPSFANWNHLMFQHMAILSGCDYLDSISGMGLKRALTLMQKYKHGDKVIRRLRLEGKMVIPRDYDKHFEMACLTFAHQLVYDPHTKQCVHLTPIAPEVMQKYQNDTNFLGPPLEASIAHGIAIGELDPDTHLPFIIHPPNASTVSTANTVNTASVAVAASTESFSHLTVNNCVSTSIENIDSCSMNDAVVDVLDAPTVSVSNDNCFATSSSTIIDPLLSDLSSTTQTFIKRRSSSGVLNEIAKDKKISSYFTASSTSVTAPFLPPRRSNLNLHPHSQPTDLFNPLTSTSSPCSSQPLSTATDLPTSFTSSFLASTSTRRTPVKQASKSKSMTPPKLLPGQMKLIDTSMKISSNISSTISAIGKKRIRDNGIAAAAVATSTSASSHVPGQINAGAIEYLQQFRHQVQSQSPSQPQSHRRKRTATNRPTVSSVPSQHGVSDDEVCIIVPPTASAATSTPIPHPIDVATFSYTDSEIEVTCTEASTIEHREDNALSHLSEEDMKVVEDNTGRSSKYFASFNTTTATTSTTATTTTSTSTTTANEHPNPSSLLSTSKFNPPFRATSFFERRRQQMQQQAPSSSAPSPSSSSQLACTSPSPSSSPNFTNSLFARRIVVSPVEPDIAEQQMRHHVQQRVSESTWPTNTNQSPATIAVTTEVNTIPTTAAATSNPPRDRSFGLSLLDSFRRNVDSNMSATATATAAATSTSTSSLGTCYSKLSSNSNSKFKSKLLSKSNSIFTNRSRVSNLPIDGPNDDRTSAIKLESVKLVDAKQLKAPTKTTTTIIDQCPSPSPPVTIIDMTSDPPTCSNDLNITADSIPSHYNQLNIDTINFYPIML